MNWDDFKNRADVLLKLEIHAIFLTFIGCALTLSGHKEEGLLVLGGAMALFKGHQS